MTAPLPMMSENEIEEIGESRPDAGFGVLETTKGALPLKAMDITAKIVGLVSRVRLKQTFVNTSDAPLEATYIFPLPDRAAVTRFRMEVEGRLIEGVLKERTAARREYDQAIQAGHRAAISEEERSNVFAMRVGNLMPGDEATVELVMTGPLPSNEGEATFRFPLVVAPRYIPGIPLEGESVGLGVAVDTDAVPDASRITPPVLLPGYPNPIVLSLMVEVDPAGLPLGALRSSLHTIVVDDTGKGRKVVSLGRGERLNRDFILRFSVGTESVESSCVLHPDEKGAREGTFHLTLTPPKDAAVDMKPRDVVFVLDRSGSMQGWKMIAARRALARMVDTLNDSDRFGVIAFDNQIEAPPGCSDEGLVAATNRNRYQAVDFLAKLDARGGTEMLGPLQVAAKRLSGGYADRDRSLILVTDGQVGNEDQILRHLSKHLKNVRVLTLGIDRSVNAGFLRRLAELGGGACELIESEDRLDEVMDRVHRRIATPLRTEMHIESRGFEVLRESFVPARIPDLFAGTPFVVTGRYRGKPNGTIEVTGSDQWCSTKTELVKATETDNSAIRSIWARGRIRSLEDEYVLSRGDRGKIEQQIIETSLGFRVLSRFTAFVAVDRSEVVNEGGTKDEVIMPVDAPDGWAMPTAVPPALYSNAALPPICASPTMSMTGSVPRGAPGGAPYLEPPPSCAPPRAAKTMAIAPDMFCHSRKADEEEAEERQIPLGDDDPVGEFRSRIEKLSQSLKDRPKGDEHRRVGLQTALTELRKIIAEMKAVSFWPGTIWALNEMADEISDLLGETERSGRHSKKVWKSVKSKMKALLKQEGKGGGEKPSRKRSFWK